MLQVFNILHLEQTSTNAVDCYTKKRQKEHEIDSLDTCVEEPFILNQIDCGSL